MDSRAFNVSKKEQGIITAKIVNKYEFNFEQFQAGLELAKDEQNPFLMKYTDIIQSDEAFILLSEFANFGSLDQVIQKKRNLSNPAIRAIMKQILEGLRLMHEKGLIHKNLKPSNILLHILPGSGRVNIKIVDYGMIKKQKQSRYSTFNCVDGTYPFLPPELMHASRAGSFTVDEKTDVWSAGIILYQLVAHKFPFPSTSQNDIKQFMQNKALDRPADIEDTLWNLITKMLEFNNEDRFTAEQSLKHIFFTGRKATKEITEEAKQLASKSIQIQGKESSPFSGITSMTQNPTSIPELSQWEQLNKPAESSSESKQSNQTESKQNNQTESKQNNQTESSTQQTSKEATQIQQDQEVSGIDYIKMVEVLKQPFIGDQNKKKDLQQQQEDECKKIITYLKDKTNDNERTQIIEAGVTKELLTSFELRDIQSIPPIYVEAFHVIVSPASKEVIQLLIIKKISHQGLFRLLDHKNIDIVRFSIKSIETVLSSSIVVSEDSQPHPFYNSISKCFGPKKLFTLIKRSDVDKTIKDLTAICFVKIFIRSDIPDKSWKQTFISHIKSIICDSDEQTKLKSRAALRYLAYNTENHTEILKGDFLKHIVTDLKRPLQGTEEEKKEIQQLQEYECVLIQAMIKDNEDKKTRKTILKAGIVDSLLEIFLQRDLSTITHTYVEAFYFLTCEFDDDDDYWLQNAKQQIPPLVHLLNHQNTKIVGDSLLSLSFIIIAGSNSASKTQKHPHFDLVSQCDGIGTLYSTFRRIDPSDTNKGMAALIVGNIFLNREIDNESIRHDIISYLKGLANDKDQWTQDESRRALKRLSKIEANRTEIEKDGFQIQKSNS
ncbi:MAG: putative AUR protein kinase [Streblomastix strix]|uniref:Putative AUR protein kinase n=1 Tax=Streblomastix strix TaxID=222440 RepID=A0A5J4W0X9_9EUKA|nr:MAG: putative AUR protein kinase [Streblomastix strix]